MYNRLYEYVQENDILYEKQFGFRANYSTDHALTEFTQNILQAFDRNEFTLGIFIDISKAFDTVDHEILLEKLQAYGIQNVNLKWFKSYLRHRKQCISILDKNTDYEYVSCGVPQGSILGPLLFLIYINDLKQVSTLLNFITFADDTSAFYSHRNILDLYNTVNSELKKVYDWFVVNRLSLNTKKTKYILFHKMYQRDNIPLRLPEILINEKKLQRKQVTKFLDVILDENITWKSHINSIETKLSKSIGIIYKVRQFLNYNCLKNLYFSMIQSHINYCNIVWGSTNKTKMHGVFKMQKKAIRLIFFQKKHTHTRSLFKKLNALNIYQLNIFQILIFMYKIKNNLAPPIFYNYFKPIKHKYSTRSSGYNFHRERYLSKTTSYKISERATFLWNTIIKETEKSAANLKKFKTTVKKVLLDKENEKILVNF